MLTGGGACQCGGGVLRDYQRGELGAAARSRQGGPYGGGTGADRLLPFEGLMLQGEEVWDLGSRFLGLRKEPVLVKEA